MQGETGRLAMTPTSRYGTGSGGRQVEQRAVWEQNVKGALHGVAGEVAPVTGQPRGRQFTRRDGQAPSGRTPTGAAARLSGSQTPRTGSVSPGSCGEGTARGRRLWSRGSELRQVAYGLTMGRGTQHPDSVSTRLDAVTHDSTAWPHPVLTADLRRAGGLRSARRGSSEVAPQGSRTGAYPSPGQLQLARPARGVLLQGEAGAWRGSLTAPVGTSPARRGSLASSLETSRVNVCV